MTSQEREQATGYCFSAVVMDSDDPGEDTGTSTGENAGGGGGGGGGGGKGKGTDTGSSSQPGSGSGSGGGGAPAKPKASTRAFLHTFRRRPAPGAGGFGAPAAHKSFLHLKINVGDLVVLSNDDGSRVAMATGKVAGMTADTVDVTTDNNLTSARNLGTVYRIDKDLTSFGKKSALTNLLDLFAPPREGGDDDKTSKTLLRRREQTVQHRSMIVDLRPPRFALEPAIAPKLAAFVRAGGVGMNMGQRRAVRSVYVP